MFKKLYVDFFPDKEIGKKFKNSNILPESNTIEYAIYCLSNSLNLDPFLALLFMGFEVNFYILKFKVLNNFELIIKY